MLGRSSDHVSSGITGMMTHLEVFEEYSKDRAEALKNYYSYVRDNDIYLAFTLINPQGDRSKTPSEHVKNVFYTLGVLEEKPQGIIVRDEYYIPNRLQLYACQVLLQSTYPKVIENIRKLSGGGVIMLPSSYIDLANPEIRDLIEKTQYSTLLAPIERVKLLKLVWDAIGSEFASRHTQYEMFYSGAPFIALSRVYEKYDWDFAKSMSRGILDSIDVS